METWILVAAVVVPLAAIVFSDDLRKLRRLLTAAFNFFRRKWWRMRKWYAHCSERELVAKLVNDPEEASPVFIRSLIDSERIMCWSTQISSGDAFRLGVIWKYRGFCASLGTHALEDGDEGGDSWTWAVEAPHTFLLLTGYGPIRDSYWTGSALIDAATTYVDSLIEESGVADYEPPLRFRAARRLHDFRQGLKIRRRSRAG